MAAGGGVGKPGGAANDAVEVWNGLDESQRSGADKDRLMQLWVQAEVGRLTNMRAAQNARAGNPGPEMSIAKLAYSELNKELYAFTINLMGAQALIDYDYTFRRPEDLDVGGTAHGLRYAFLRVRANSIEGGTSEIMRNILGEQVLGLPGEPRVDKSVPWSQVPRS
ncbi:MAG: acyl-CoA dehydrogenase family protein [Ilumatobacteraceae bacterium]